MNDASQGVGGRDSLAALREEAEARRAGDLRAAREVMAAVSRHLTRPDPDEEVSRGSR